MGIKEEYKIKAGEQWVSEYYANVDGESTVVVGYELGDTACTIPSKSVANSILQDLQRYYPPDVLILHTARMFNK